MRQSGPALERGQGADGLVPESDRTGRDAQHGRRKGRGGTSGMSHLCHAAQPETEIKIKTSAPKPKHTHTGRSQR